MNRVRVVPFNVCLARRNECGTRKGARIDLSVQQACECPRRNAVPERFARARLNRAGR
jgi:hypothetical protein